MSTLAVTLSPSLVADVFEVRAFPNGHYTLRLTFYILQSCCRPTLATCTMIADSRYYRTGSTHCSDRTSRKHTVLCTYNMTYLRLQIILF